ncbi:MAG: carboxylating nicotinate-nucleotide diphosphorylase [Atopobiaceae bacterium]|jgi:nicotinate-nucleotide pyrophosphorylase (carboxylating)|nr:carboxylating nicotinate-nucleotide diphosphorylase [Atopobiaceae bacterium]MCI2173369.1 carboxylating nicotinate-nucleotide diphosphorylase [Atopobiaceae bacterium]MCI2207364.1 carboxylating nicotinate-nucleotide diphosphorylase [Atopobiaceae bacterium]
MDPVTLNVVADRYLRLALEEDITSEDVSCACVMPDARRGVVDLIAKGPGVICGLDVFGRVFSLLDRQSQVERLVGEGDEVESGELVAHVSGDVRALLSGERTALNYLQRMSGIATHTRRMVRALEGTHATLVDTRKTTPCMRVFEKEAVRTGGGTNHRYNLSDGVMLKDNHIDAAGGIAPAVAAARVRAPFVRKVEVEVESLDQVREALDAGADIIMLDNMDLDRMRQAVDMIAGRAQTEASGNVDLESVHAVAECGVDFISCGALTHSSPILDLSMKHLRVEEEA